MVGSFNNWIPILMQDRNEILKTEQSEEPMIMVDKIDLKIQKLKNQRTRDLDIDLEKIIINSVLKVDLLDLIESK